MNVTNVRCEEDHRSSIIIFFFNLIEVLYPRDFGASTVLKSKNTSIPKNCKNSNNCKKKKILKNFFRTQMYYDLED